jgi:hypothetical protein
MLRWDVRANYWRLEKLCVESGQDPAEVRRLIRATQLPAPSYVLPGGDERVPQDYFYWSTRRAALKACGRSSSAVIERRGVRSTSWQRTGRAIWRVSTEFVCGRSPPETIVRKSELVTSIESLLAEAKPTDAAWQGRLRQEVQELDGLEREFSPDYDRSRYGTPPSRDRLIAVAHERYSEIFAEAGVPGS